MEKYSKNLELFDTLLKNDKKFKKSLKKIVSVLKNNGNSFIDDHRNVNVKYELNVVNICQKTNNKGDFLRYDNTSIPNVWIFPGGKEYTQCKNPLYVINNELHLTTRSQGGILFDIDQKKLIKGEIVMQEYITHKELNFALPIEILLSIKFDNKRRESDEIPSIEI